MDTVANNRPMITDRISPESARNKGSKFLVLALLAIILCLNAFCLPRLSITYDEYWHWLYGRNILDSNPSRPSPWFDSKMPFSVFNAIPSKIAALLHEGSAAAPSPYVFKENLRGARFVTILFSLCLAFYVFRWSKELYGPAAGILSLFLYTFSPNVIAHSHLVTADLYVTCMVTIATYYFWKFMNARNWKNASVSAATLGIAQLTKYTAVYLYPIFTLIALSSMMSSVRILTPNRKTSLEMIGSSVKSYLRYAAFFLLISVIFINIGFIGYRSFTFLKNYEFQSGLFQRIQNTGLKHLPIPIPYPYLKGLDMVIDLEAKGTTHGNLYLLGKLHTRVNNRIEGFPGYFLYTLLFKEPIAMQVLILFAVFFYGINRRKFAFFENELFLVIPVLFFLVYFDFFFSTHIGIRFILVVLPFLYILSGCFLKSWKAVGLRIQLGCATLCLYLLCSVLSYFPHYLSYFNELVWNRTKAYKILADSNLDWGQSELYLERYKKTHPDAIVNPTDIISGRIVVTANNLVGVGVDPEEYAWLRNNFEPVGHIAYSYLVYEIKPESIENIKEKASNRNFKNPIIDQGR